MGSWDENDVKDKVKDWYINLITVDNSVDPSVGTGVDPSVGTGVKLPKVKIDEIKKKVDQLPPEKSKEILKKIIDEYPPVTNILERLIWGH